ncbi:MAG: signal peptidase II [Chloroflexi bacterium]|nr:signal peptidase II [Chloroflexota bacterium]
MKRLLFVVITACIVVADQTTKAWVSRSIPVGNSVNVLPPVVYLYHATNDGVAWSLFRGHTQLFSAVAIAFCMGVLVLGRTAMQRSYALTVAMAMLLGGSVGNLIDRLRYHYVVDFIDVHLGNFYRWPTFNVADSSITIGMAVLVGYFWHVS